MASVLSWILHFLLPADPHGVVDLAARVFDLNFAVFGWGAGVVVGLQKQLHGGGTRDLTDAARDKFFVILMGAVVLLVVCAVLLCLDRLEWYYGGALILMCVLVGEIGWGRPLLIW